VIQLTFDNGPIVVESGSIVFR